MLCDDHSVVRAGFRVLLEREPDLSILAEASSGPEAVALAEQHQPDLILLDLSMPSGNGFDAIGRIRAVAPRCRILVLSMHAAPEYVRPALRAGAEPVIDASGLQTLDTAAIAVLLQCERLVAESGRQLRINGMPPKLAELARLYGVEALLGADSAEGAAPAA